METKVYLYLLYVQVFYLAWISITSDMHFIKLAFNACACVYNIRVMSFEVEESRLLNRENILETFKCWKYRLLLNTNVFLVKKFFFFFIY